MRVKIAEITKLSCGSGPDFAVNPASSNTPIC